MTPLVFFGASSYSLPILEKLLTLSDFPVVLIVTKTDKPFGRNQKITPNPVAKFATDHRLPLLQVEAFTPEIKSQISVFKADLALCVAFGPPFFDEEMINLFPHKIINIHPSPLPKYRGATPGPWQIINGEHTSAVSFFQIDPLPDHGPIITQIPFDISPTDTSQSFYERAFSLAANNLDNVLKNYLTSPTSLTPQDHTQKSYYPKLTKDSAKIDWTWSVDKIERFIRALNPFPISWTFVENMNGQLLKMKIFSANLDKNKSELLPNIVQIEGKNKSTWQEIKKYYQIKSKN